MDTQTEIMDELEESIAAGDRADELIRQGIKAIRAATGSPGEIRVPAMTELVRVFTEVAQVIADSGSTAEVLDNGVTFPEDFLAQLIMVHLPNPDENLTIGEKERWLRVAHWMGPDWVSSFTKTGAFMRKVEGF